MGIFEMRMRMKLRAVEPEDADFMYDAECDADAWKYSDYVAPLSRELLRQYALTYDADPFRAGQLRLIIELDGQPIGIADLFEISARHLRADTGLYIFPDNRGHGTGTEALKQLSEYCRDRLGLHQLTATISESNPHAVKAYLKAGFKETGRRPDWLRTTSGFEDALTLSLIL